MKINIYFKSGRKFEIQHPSKDLAKTLQDNFISMQEAKALTSYSWFNDGSMITISEIEQIEIIKD